MPVIGRLVLLVYNLLMLVISGAVVAVSMGWFAPLAYYDMAVSTPENKIIMGTVGIIIGIIALIMLIWGLKPSNRTDAVTVEKGLAGEVSISIAAIKVIIMKAVKQVEGVKDIKSVVSSTAGGLIVKLHIMINPEHTVPELAQSLQAAVKDNLEKIGGLQVAEIKVLVDDFNVVSK
ncbi:MAG: alkaline shock response membrane anchor protein AmaP [Syntrophomonas sp.]|nr:alkaline shock response membrane anchor protein AmaP [Syntrophomonas sp.]